MSWAGLESTWWNKIENNVTEMYLYDRLIIDILWAS